MYNYLHGGYNSKLAYISVLTIYDGILFSEQDAYD